MAIKIDEKNKKELAWRAVEYIDWGEEFEDFEKSVNWEEEWWFNEQVERCGFPTKKELKEFRAILRDVWNLAFNLELN